MTSGTKELVSFVVEDNLSSANDMAIEVRVTMADGEERWCFFMTPAAMAACGDWIPGSTNRYHLGVPHMIVVSRIDSEVIAKVLALIDDDGLLRAHTVSIGPD